METQENKGSALKVKIVEIYIFFLMNECLLNHRFIVLVVVRSTVNGIPTQLLFTPSHSIVMVKLQVIGFTT